MLNIGRLHIVLVLALKYTVEGWLAALWDQMLIIDL